MMGGVSDDLGLTGKVVDGAYLIETAVAAGGFGLIYRARHLTLDIPVAIKALHVRSGLSRWAAECLQVRFRLESKLLYRLCAENLAIVRSLGCGVTVAPATGGFVPYYAMEWLDGESLSEAVRRWKERGSLPSLEETVALLDDAVQGLAAAHAMGVTHRDVKPGNIFLLAGTADRPRSKLLDFGIAKVLGGARVGIGPSGVTRAGEAVCTPGYAAPEQFEPKFGAVGPATDVYALALLLCTVMSGTRVVIGRDMSDYARIACDPKRRPSPRSVGLELPPNVEAVLERALAIEPCARWPDAGVFWGTLKHAMQDDDPQSFVRRRPVVESNLEEATVTDRYRVAGVNTSTQ